MIILNATLKGENIYEVTVDMAGTFIVSAFDVDRAIDVVADYIEQHTAEYQGYFSQVAFRIMAECSGYDVRDYAKLKGFVECGTNKIYIPIIGIKEVSV